MVTTVTQMKGSDGLNSAQALPLTVFNVQRLQ